MQRTRSAYIPRDWEEFSKDACTWCQPTYGLEKGSRLALLHRLRLLLKTLKGPCVVGGDWNLEPNMLPSTGWARRLGGEIFAPDGPNATTNAITTSW